MPATGRRRPPESEEEQREQEEQAQKDAREKEEAQREGVAPQAGGTPGGGSESQQIQQKQQDPESLGGDGEPEIPDYDVETARGVYPAQVVANPGEFYDDDAAGKPEDAADGE